MDLFDSLITSDSPTGWQPSSPPSLNGVDEIELDCETTGLQWWEKDRPVGFAICLPNGRCQYLPFAHRGGGNLDEATMLRWARTELRGKRIRNLNTRFDIHMLREWGVDLEEQGCTVTDVGHYAALLDDHRQSLSLENISRDYLGIGKLGQDLDKTKMAWYHAGAVAAYAEQDVRLVHELNKVMMPMLDAQDLQRVRQLEDDVIFVVCEMERNGAVIDHELLDRWLVQSEQEVTKALWAIHRLVGFRVNPGSNEDKLRLFRHLKLPLSFLPSGAPSFTDNVIKQHVAHEPVRLLRRAIRLSSLRSKYLVKYKNALDSHGILRYSLHQLKAQKDEIDDAGAGTISGRFSSTAISDDVGVNIQQVMKTGKQRVSFGYEENDDTHDDEIFVVRQLHVPGRGLHLAADAMQIEYRLFAHYAQNPRVLEAYKQDPYMSFHKLVWTMLKEHKRDLTYRRAKDCNFAKIYGAGLTKLSEMLEFITAEEAAQLRHERAHRDHPKLATALEVEKIYNRELPEVGPLLERASNLARTRGYVKTILGRRTRFPDKSRLHKALNGVIQGSAADIMKRKLVELHRERKHTGFTLRYTVHDEVDGDVPDQESADKVSKILNTQSFPEITVPILWEVGTGRNWKECA